MTLTKSQSALWLKTLQSIKDEEKFNIREWLQFEDPGESSCGTAACIYGWAALHDQQIEESFFKIKKGEFEQRMLQYEARNMGDKLGIRGSEEKIYELSAWQSENQDLYIQGFKYRAVLQQVKHVFRERDIHFHPDFCELLKELE